MFNPRQVQYALNEIIQGGLVLETNISEIGQCGELSTPKSLPNSSVQAVQRNRKASAASANPLLPSLLVAPGARQAGGGGAGGVAGGARRWLSSIGV